MTDFSTYDLLAQAVGLIASGFIIFGFSQKADDRLKIFMFIGALTFSFHFFLIGAYAGCAINIVSACRTALSFKFNKSTPVMCFFLILYVIFGYVTYEAPSDIFPVFSSMLSTFAMYKLSGIKMRVCLIFSSLSWLTYATIHTSIGGMITETFVQFTTWATIYRITRDKKKQSYETPN